MHLFTILYEAVQLNRSTLYDTVPLALSCNKVITCNPPLTLVHWSIAMKTVTKSGRSAPFLYQYLTSQHTTTIARLLKCNCIAITRTNSCQYANKQVHYIISGTLTRPEDTRPRLRLLRLNITSSSGACRGRSRCHELSPCRSVLRTSLGWRQAKVHWLQVGLHRSQPGQFGSASPPSPLHRRAHDASLEGSVMILPRVGAAEVTIERETTSTDSIGQKRLPSTKTDLIIGNQFGPVDIQDASKAPIIQSVNLFR